MRVHAKSKPAALSIAPELRGTKMSVSETRQIAGFQNESGLRRTASPTDRAPLLERARRRLLARKPHWHSEVRLLTLLALQPTRILATLRAEEPPAWRSAVPN
jgi:hypothetical protein